MGAVLEGAVDKAKLQAMLDGKTVVTNDAELDRLQALANERGLFIRTLPHAGRVGLLDQYDAWIGGRRP